MLGILKVLRPKSSVPALPFLSRAAPTSAFLLGLGCTRHLVTSANAFAVGDSTRSGSLDLFDR